MSFCPTKDIHSVYLDNELPEVYKGDYEKHLTQCSECRKDFEELKHVKDALQADAKEITPDDQFLEDSYQRLMIKMSYNNNAVKANKKSLFNRFTYILSAAAAVFALALFIPLGLHSKKNVVTPQMISVQNMNPMTNFANNISFGSGNNMVISGNMNDMLSCYTRDCVSSKVFGDVNNFDLLSPDFGNDNMISIKIAVPRVGDIPTGAKMASFGIVLSGNYEWNLLEK